MHYEYFFLIIHSIWQTCNQYSTFEKRNNYEKTLLSSARFMSQEILTVQISVAQCQLVFMFKGIDNILAAALWLGFDTLCVCRL